MYFYAIFAISLAVARHEREQFLLVAGSLLGVIITALFVGGDVWKFYGNEVVV